MPAAPAATPNSAPTGDGRLPGEARLPRGGRVLVIRLSALGDVLFALETVAALKQERPDVVVDFLVEDRFRSLLDGHPQLANVLVYPRQRHRAIPGSLWRLRRQRYDVVLDVHGILKSALHVRFCHSPCKVGPAAPAARYDVKHEWGDGAHSDLHGGVLLPDILRWMFRDWPKE